MTETQILELLVQARVSISKRFVGSGVWQGRLCKLNRGASRSTVSVEYSDGDSDTMSLSEVAKYLPPSLALSARQYFSQAGNDKTAPTTRVSTSASNMRDKKTARVREPCSTGGTKGALLRLTRSLYLTPSTENQPESSLLPGLMKPYLRSSAETKIKEYQTYLSSKLHTEQSITVGPEDLELLCRGKPLLNEMTLKEVWEEYWNSLEDDLQLTYRRRKACMLTWALKTLPEDLLTHSGLCQVGSSG